MGWLQIQRKKVLPNFHSLEKASLVNNISLDFNTLKWLWWEMSDDFVKAMQVNSEWICLVSIRVDFDVVILIYACQAHLVVTLPLAESQELVEQPPL